MREHIERIFGLLSVERDLYSELLRLSTQKKDAVTESKVSLLDEIVRSEQTLLIKLGEAERRRKRETSQLAKLCGKPEDKMTLTEVAALADAGMKTRLMALREELSGILQEQMVQNDQNKSLIESRLEYINYMLSAVSDSSANTGLYSDKGAPVTRKPGKLGLLDRKV